MPKLSGGTLKVAIQTFIPHLLFAGELFEASFVSGNSRRMAVISYRLVGRLIFGITGTSFF